ncbi:hypothetical protein GQ457_04G025550 [Hibiscus cannabinus]
MNFHARIKLEIVYPDIFRTQFLGVTTLAIRLMDIENDYFLVTFKLRSDYLKVLADGPWTIFGHYLTVQQWTPEFTTAIPYPTKVMVWIRLPGLSVPLYKKSIIEEIGRRGRFSRMALSIDLSKPLILKILFNGRVQLIEYESLPVICFNCGKYGHAKEIFPDLLPKPDHVAPAKVHDKVKPSETSSDAPLSRDPCTDDSFWPWMLAERRPRCTPRVQKTASTSAPIQNLGSRFSPIIVSDIDEEVAFSAGTKVTHTVSSQHDRTSLNSSTLKASGKKKVVSSGKAPRVSLMRKTLQVNLSDFPPLDTTRHSTIVMKENADPNIVNLPRGSNATMVIAEGSIMGAPPDRSDPAAGGQFADCSLPIPVFSYLGTKKRMLMARLRGIQRTLCHRPSRFLSSLETEFLVELEHLLDQEEILWRQKSRSDWISQGDRNTSYFHRRAISRRQRSRITTLKLIDGSWCDDESKLKEEAACFFQNLFTDNDPISGSFPNSNSYPTIPNELLQSLDVVPSSEEIYLALMDMAPLKSPD